MDVCRTQGDLLHDALREQVTLILFSGLCINCFTKLKRYVTVVKKGCSPAHPLGKREEKSHLSPPVISHILPDVQWGLNFSRPVWSCNCLPWTNHSWFLNPSKLLGKLASFSCECMQETKCLFFFYIVTFHIRTRWYKHKTHHYLGESANTCNQ